MFQLIAPAQILIFVTQEVMAAKDEEQTRLVKIISHIILW